MYPVFCPLDIEFSKVNHPTFRSFPRIWKVLGYGRLVSAARAAYSIRERDEEEVVGGPLTLSSAVSASLKPDRDSATHRASISSDKSQHITVLRIRLGVEQVARVENRFGSHRQAKTRKFLRHLNTQRWIVNT